MHTVYFWDCFCSRFQVSGFVFKTLRDQISTAFGRLYVLNYLARLFMVKEENKVSQLWNPNLTNTWERQFWMKEDVNAELSYYFVRVIVACKLTTDFLDQEHRSKLLGGIQVAGIMIRAMENRVHLLQEWEDKGWGQESLLFLGIYLFIGSR